MTSISISQLVSYLGLLIPVFVTCSTNYGGRPGKLITCNEVLRHWVDVWRSGTFFLYSCKVASEPKKRCQDCLMLSAQLFYGPCLQSVGSSFTCCFLGLCHSTTHSTKCLGTSLNMISFTRPPPALVLQATNAGVEGLGIKTIDGFHSIFSLGNWRALHTMLTADWSISKSHDLFAFQFLWWRCYGTHL